VKRNVICYSQWSPVKVTEVTHVTPDKHCNDIRVNQKNMNKNDTLATTEYIILVLLSAIDMTRYTPSNETILHY